MNKLLLTFFALFATLTTALAADLGFSADKLYRIDCACYAGQGAVVLGAKHDQTIYLYYLQGTSYPDDAWWHIEPVGDGSYTFRNAVSEQYMTADNDLYDTTTGKYLKLTDTDEGDMSHWTFEETTYNNQTYYKVKCVSSAISNPYFNMRTSAYMLGGYGEVDGENGKFTFYEKSDGGTVTPDPEPTPTPTPTGKITDYYTSASINGKGLTYDSANETYYYSLPEALRQGGDFEAAITATWNAGYETGYELRLNGQAPDATTGNITLSSPTCQTPYTLGVYTTDGTLKATAPLNFTFLPIVEINTEGNDIGYYSYTAGTIRVAEADAARPDTVITAKYKIRGASSTGYQKKSYAIKLYDANGSSFDYSFFGLRSDNNWILDAMYIDGACMRNRVATDLWNDFSVRPYYAAKEQKALTGTRGHFVEVFMNGTYHGLYCMTEKLDRKQLKLKKYQAADPTVAGSTGKVRGLLYKTSQWGYEVHMGHNSGNKNYPGTSPSGYSNTLGRETWCNYELKYPDYAEEAVEFGPMYNAVNFVCTSSQTDFESGVKSYFDFATTRDYYLFIDLLLATDNHGKNMFYYVYDHSKSDLVGMAPWDLDGTFGIRWDGSTSYTSDATQDLDTFLWQYEHGQMGLYDKLAQSTTLSWDNYLAARYATLRRSQFQPAALAQRFATYASLFADSHADVREQNNWSNHSGIQSAATYAQKWVQERVAALDQKYDYGTLVSQQPIVASTPEAPVWYGIDLGTGTGSWTAASGQIDADKISLCATGLPLSQQWCFVGSADEGYKIYNRANQQYLVSNGTNNTFGTEDEASIFLLSTSTATTGAKPYYCWRVAKNKYLAMNDGATALAVGTTTNAQASWQFTPNNSYVLAYAQAYANIPEGALGMPAYLAEADHLAQYKAVYEAAAANATDANIAALVAMTQQIEQGGSPSVDIDNLNGGYYRIVNASTTGAHHMLAVQSAGTTLSTIAPTTANADAVWQLSQIATSGQLALYHPNHAQYVQANRAEVGEGAQAYSLTAQGKAMFALQVNDNALTEAADGTVELTANATSANAGCWYLVPATTLDVNLNAVADGRSYATVYLPFGISHVEGAEAYVGDAPLDGRINVTATESFAAKTGILLVSNESNDQATLTIGQGDNLYSAISGSLVQFSISDAERKDYLVFGRNAADLAQVGFFTPQRTTLSANRGFVRTDAYEALTLNFDRITTATGAVKQQSGNAPVYYDLTGRRVLNPLKGGIYITGGRKVVF